MNLFFLATWCAWAAVAAQETSSVLPVRLDHFHATNTDTLPMRFLYSEEFAPAGNVSYAFIHVGGSHPLDADCLQDGLMRRMAQLLNATMFCTEHRYYGQSLPTSGLETASLRWLSGEQATADLAQLVQHIRDDFQDGRYRSVRVQLVGCGEGGALAAWARRAYPHLMASALVDSAPLGARIDFGEYVEKVWSSLVETGGTACASQLRSASDGIRSLMQSAVGSPYIAQHFNTCTVPTSNEPLHPALMQWLGVVRPLGGLVATARPGDLAEFCASFTNSTIQDPVARLGAWVVGRAGGVCLEARHALVVAALVAATNITEADPEHANMRVQLYQSCTQLGWLPTSSSGTQQLLAPTALPVSYYHRLCADVFGQTYFDESVWSEGVERVNLMLGASQLADHVLWAGGGSPWAALGPNPNAANPPTTQIFNVDEGHCRVIGPAEETDSAELVHTRNWAIVHTLSWLTGEPYHLEGFDNAAASLSPTTTMLVVSILLLAGVIYN